MKKIYQIFVSLFLLFVIGKTAHCATYYSRGGGGAWATPATWSTVGCNGAAATSFPGAADNVIICASNATAVTITVTGARSCNNLTIGTGTANATVNMATGANTLAINGNLSFNTGNTAGTFTLNASASAVTILGTVSWTTTQGTNRFLASTGTLNFTQDLVITNANQLITLSGAAKVNFSGNFTDNQNKLTTASACSVKFSANYTVSGVAATWNAASFAVFNGNEKTITPNATITFGNVTVDVSASVSANASTGSVSLARDLALNPGASLTLNTPLSVGYSVVLASTSVLTMNADLTIARNWTNNGGTLIGNSRLITFSGYGYTIGGTSATSFPDLNIGVSGATTRFAYTQNSNVTCLSLTLQNNSFDNTSSYTLGTGNPTLLVTGNLVIRQLSTLRATSLYINGGSCTVNGNLTFSGSASSSSAQITQVIATTGTFVLDGTLTWLTQTGVGSQTATEVIQTTTGTLTFNSSVAMPIGSGTIRTTGIGTINFNGNAAPSLDYNAIGEGSIYAVLSTVSGGVVNFRNGITNSYTLTFAAGSTQNFLGSGTINPIAALRFGTVGIASGASISAAGSFGVQNSWTNLGTFVPNTSTITFNGASTATQAITRTGGETFYNLTVTTASATLTLANNLMVTNSLAMTGHSINLSGNTLTLGDNGGAVLNRTAGQLYGGTFKRYWPAATAVTTGTLNKYGLFPIGISTGYRPLLIVSTVSPVTGGYVSVVHNGVYSVTYVTYNDGVNPIQALSDQSTTLSTTGLAGGTYNIDVYYAGFNSTGVLSDLKLETFTSGTPGAVGTHATTTGTLSAPTCKRTAVSAAQLNNVFVAGTKNKTATPILNYYYSRVASGNWNSTTSWSLTAGGAGASCSCVPISTSYVVISPGQTISIASATTVDYLTVQTGSTLNGSSNLTVTRELNVVGTATIAPSAGVWSFVDLNLTGTGNNYSSAAISVSGIMTTATGSSLTMNAALTITGDLIHNGVLSIGGNTVTLSGAASKTISGTGNINGSSGAVNITTASKSILAMSSLTISPAVNLAAAVVVTNNGTVTLGGDLTGASAASGWINAAGSVLNTEGALLNTGVLTASAFPNTVNYRSTGAQTVRATTYDILTCRISGTKTLAGNAVVNSFLGIYNSAILDEGIYTITGTCGIEMSGNAELKIQRSVGGVFPEVSGAANLIGGMITIEQTGGTSKLVGQVFPSLKLNGTNHYDLSDLTQINGNLQILNAALVDSIGGITVTGTLTYSSSGALAIDNDISAGALVITAGTVDDRGNTITVTGAGFTKNGGTFTNTGLMKFTGSIEQLILGTVPITLNQVTVQNSGTGVTLNQALTITNTLNLVSGKINTDAINILTLADDATVTQSVITSFVNGVMRKIGNDEFVFPLGHGIRPGRVGISAPASAATVFTAEYKRLDHGNTFVVQAPLVRASGEEHWLLDRTGSASGIEVTLYWENAAVSMIDDCSSLTVAHWNGSSWENEPATTSGSCSGAGRITTNSPMYSFSPYTFGSTDPHNNPLPVTLTSFTATANSGSVAVSWTTVSESNSDFFTVERSEDGVNFNELTKTDAAGNSNSTLHYSAQDADPLSGISYYRLKQTDFDGKFTYSDIVPVMFKTDNSKLINIHPTPSIGNIINLQVDAALTSRKFDFTVYDIRGKLVYSETVNPADSLGNISIAHDLIPGAYFLVIDSEGITERVPVIIVN